MLVNPDLIRNQSDTEQRLRTQRNKEGKLPQAN